MIWFENSELCPSNANIKLDVDGGQIIISDDNGTVIASASYPASLERISFARTTDGGDQWANTDKPTPGKSNSSSTFGSAQLSAPAVSAGSQVFTSTMNITVDIPSGTSLRYTTDGTLPLAETPEPLFSGTELTSTGALPSSIILVLPTMNVAPRAIPSLAEEVPSMLEVLSLIQRKYTFSLLLASAGTLKVTSFQFFAPSSST